MYHQLGHNSTWNIDSKYVDKVGDKIILSPLNYTKKLERQIASDKAFCNDCIFDPQFYIPRSQKKQFKNFDFFPEVIAEGFETTNFHLVAQESAEKCISYQLDNKFSAIVIPTFYKESVDSKNISAIEENIIEPYLKIIQEKSIENEIILTVSMSEVQLKDDDYFEALLNHATRYDLIDSVYIISHYPKAEKRIKDTNYLFQLMKFIDIIKSNGMKVYVGYTDIDSIVLTLANPNALTIGVYENLRKFQPDRFDEKDGRSGPPSPRVYSRKLMQWIRYDFFDSMKMLIPDYKSYFDDNQYKVEMFQPSFNWNFQRPELYKHYFLSFHNQLNLLPHDFEERYQHIKANIKEAIILFEEIDEAGILLEKNSNGDHLPLWNNAIEMFYKYKRGE